MEPQSFVFEVADDEVGARLDKYLASQAPDLSRTQIQRLIAAGDVQVAAATVSTNYRVRRGDVVTLLVPPPRSATPVPEDLALTIVYEDTALLVINKPPGLVVHPAPGHASGTLVNALLFHCSNLSGVGGEERPGIVHRLDKETSGLLLVAKHDRSHRHLSAQLQARHLRRQYVALVRGRLPAAQGTIDAPIGRHPQHRQKMAVVTHSGRAARTHYQVLEAWGPLSLLRLRLETGRTHQIRVHLAHIGHAVVGDPVYGPGPVHVPTRPVLAQALRTFPRQALHAESLRFQHPESGVWMEYSAPLPADMATLVEQVRQAFGEAGETRETVTRHS